MFTGVALLNYGSSEYFAGSMLNFMAGVNARSCLLCILSV